MLRRVSTDAQNLSETPVASSPTPSRFLSQVSALSIPTQVLINLVGEPALGSSPQRLGVARGDPSLLLPPPYLGMRNARPRGRALLRLSAIPLDPIDLIQQDMRQRPAVRRSQPNV